MTEVAGPFRSRRPAAANGVRTAIDGGLAILGLTPNPANRRRVV